QNSQSPPPPQPDDVDVVQQLNALPQSEARARFRKLLPLIDDLVRQGVTYGAIAAALKAAGIALKPKSIRQATWRWRNQRPTTGVVDTAPAVRATAPVATASVPPPPRPPTAGSITSKADLVQLRKAAGTIDLNRLAEIGRRK
ncbi:hypothetical protein N7373_18580, partial [Achromobacter mucicolens]